jgi:PAS domain S-box-containing protein
VAVTEGADRESTERALRQSEERFAKAFQASPLPISISRLDDGVFLDVNDAFVATFGYARPEVVGHTALELGLYGDPADRERVVAALRREGRLRNFEMAARTRSGEVRHFAVNVEFLELGGEACVLSAGSDITARRASESAAQAQAERARLMADLSRAFVEAGLDCQDVLRTVAERTAAQVGDACVITLFAEDGRTAVPAAFHHARPRALGVIGRTLANWGGSTDAPSFQALLAGQTVYVPVAPAAFRDSVDPDFLPYLDEVGISSMLLTPLQVRGRVIGSLGMTRDRGRPPYTAEDRQFLEELAARAALTIENARLFEAITEHREQLGHLSARLVATQEAERRAIARELHDEVGQLLTSLRFLAEAGERAGVPLAREQVTETTSRVLERIRDLSLNLRPPMLDDLGLVPTLLWHLERYEAQTGVRVRFRHRGVGDRYGAETEMAMFRIVQEALTNVARHAGVREARVELERDEGFLVVRVEDEGRGFAHDTAAASGGLTGMRERARLLGGALTIASAPGRGTRLRAAVPVGALVESAP